jgi:hypothetical protein
MFVATAKLLISKRLVSKNASLTGCATVWLLAYKISFLVFYASPGKTNALLLPM